MFVKIVELCHLTYLKVQPVLDFRIVKFKLCKILIIFQETSTLSSE